MANVTEPDYKKILLNLLGSLTLDDHMGDVCNSVSTAAKQAQFDIGDNWGELCDLQRPLHLLGATTLYGRPLWYDYDEEQYQKECAESEGY